MIVADVVQLLLAAPAIAGLVGSRVYAGLAPETASTDPSKRYPYVVVRKSSAQHVHHMLGRAGLAATRVEIDSYAPSYAAAENLGDLVRQFLDGFAGPARGNVTSIRGAFLDDEQDTITAPIHADEWGVQASTQQYTVWHTES